MYLILIQVTEHKLTTVLKDKDMMERERIDLHNAYWNMNNEYWNMIIYQEVK